MNHALVSEVPAQKYLGPKMLIAFITLMNMFIPLSTDLYLPALPTMSNQFNCSPAITNLTLSVFFFFYAFGVLLWGPLSDKHGRKPILMLATILYIISSSGCALAMNASVLIFFRILQGIGSGGITSISTAMVKDCYRGKPRETALAITQSMSGLAPMIAPIIGAWMLSFSSWRMTFIVLTAIGVASFALACLYTESHPLANRHQGNVWDVVGRLAVVSQNKSFIIPATIFALNMLPFMGYISLSSYIYIDHFGQTEQQYSYYFAANALFSLLGPILYVRFFIGLNKKWFATTCFLISTCSGVFVMAIGTRSPLLFLVSFMMMSLMNTLLRPFSTNIIMEQHSGDTGSVASILNTLFMVMGSLGMFLASLPLGNIVVALGALITIFALLSLISWGAFMKSVIPCIGVKEGDSLTIAKYVLD